ncbi:MAG: tetratricopeptide repeat protein [Candidatus Krumholzibacteriota bacterium]|nr:tetratricopeptide repeat protein [Candidatus Krumholzibacteriota bacterium]
MALADRPSLLYIPAVRKRIGIGILSCTLFLAGCASSGKPSAQERADQLNEEKTRGAELVANGEYQAAVDVLTPLSKTASGDAQVLLLLGEAHEGTGATADAIRSYEQAIRLSYGMSQSHLRLATLLMREEKIGRALTEFQLAIQYGEHSALAHFNYGLALHRMGRGTEALEEWKRARDIDRDDARFAEAVGIGLTAHDPQEAIEAFRDAESLGASGAVFANNFGLALQATGAFNEAERWFRLAVEEDPAGESYRFNLAALLTRRGDYDVAAAEWEDMLRAFGEHWSYRVYLARCRIEKRRFDEALAAVEKIAVDFDSGAIRRSDEVIDRLPPGLDEALEIIALAWRGKGSDARALGLIRRAVELAPESASHLNNYGVILAENGMLDEAKAQWRKVLEIDPENATARENLSAFRR